MVRYLVHRSASLYQITFISFHHLSMPFSTSAASRGIFRPHLQLPSSCKYTCGARQAGQGARAAGAGDHHHHHHHHTTAHPRLLGLGKAAQPLTGFRKRIKKGRGIIILSSACSLLSLPRPHRAAPSQDHSSLTIPPRNSRHSSFFGRRLSPSRSAYGTCSNRYSYGCSVSNQQLPVEQARLPSMVLSRATNGRSPSSLGRAQGHEVLDPVFAQRYMKEPMTRYSTVH